MNLFGVSLGLGNAKVGDAFTFSLPSKSTCPGASAWCLRHCYSWRYECRRPACRNAYHRNLQLAKDPERLVRTVVGVLPRIAPAVRIHVSGDFFCPEYADAWTRICAEFPRTPFWAYTRSWASPEMLPSLQRLRSLPNVQLFASTDPTMLLPPQGWRRAFIHTDKRAQGLTCPYQMGRTKSCLTCGFCLRPGGDVVFRTH